MKIIDLTRRFIEHVIHKGDPEAYWATYPGLFDHYYTFWARRAPFDAALTPEFLKARVELISGELPSIESEFEEAGFSVRHVEVVLFVGQGTTNGHAFRDGDRFIVWIPVETYPTELMVRVFLSHEIAHALHYDRTPDFYFRTPSERKLLARQVLTEGVASYLPLVVLGLDEKTALWADYLPAEKAESWFRKCLRHEQQLNRQVYDRWSNEETELFVLNDLNDVFKSRGGYFVGLRLVESMIDRSGMDVRSILELEREEFERHALNLLQQSSKRGTFD
jgi:uncharacterized protein YjaZ